MEQNLHNTDPWDLIAKMLAEEASSVEKEAFAQWIQKDPLHQQQWEEAKAIWPKQAQRPANSRPNTDNAWKAMEARMQTVQASPAKTRSLKIRPIYIASLAAAFALLLLFWRPWEGAPALKTLVTQSQLAEVSLSDGSQVWLNAKSSLQYAKKMKGAERRIQLKGEAFFEVARDEKRPFVIEAGDTRVQVLGTSFNVRAYQDEGLVELSVKSGKVLFFKGEKLLPDSSNARILVAGEQAIIGGSNTQPVMQEITQANYLAWKDNELIFNNASILQVVEALSRYYGVNFEWENEQLTDMKFHADSAYKNVSLSVILDEIMISNQNKIQFEKKEGGYLIK